VSRHNNSLFLGSMICWTAMSSIFSSFWCLYSYKRENLLPQPQFVFTVGLSTARLFACIQRLHRARINPFLTKFRKNVSNLNLLVMSLLRRLSECFFPVLCRYGEATDFLLYGFLVFQIMWDGELALDNKVRVDVQPTEWADSSADVVPAATDDVGTADMSWFHGRAYLVTKASMNYRK
jgi:hypothetical protein